MQDIWDVGSSPGSGRSPGGGSANSLQYSCLENAMDMDRGTWWAMVQHSRLPCHHQLSELAQIHVHWLDDPIQPTLCCPLLLLPSIFPSIRVFSNESVYSSLELDKALPFSMRDFLNISAWLKKNCHSKEWLLSLFPFVFPLGYQSLRVGLASLCFYIARTYLSIQNWVEI